ncbi:MULTISPECIES: TetR/AcrR family transcriptional regulator [unclassified Mycobacterium]|uniref:TetR/AcrR family transcriptional regulator n=1 Tax=unclassified Mycobacterium TaxID=2642494 RepID=UPI0029C94A98|nr:MULTISPECIES: TetR/AcrR family transcriptional regulator [unclassified Mycobacterium]
MPGRGDLQRARLIDAVLDLLQTTSIAELSVMQIAKRAGVTRPVFYFYFDSKYAVLAAALSQVWAEFAAARPLTDGLDLTQPPGLITRNLTRDAIGIWREHHALIAAVVEARSSDEQLARLWDELTAQAGRQVCQVVGLLKSVNLVRPASDNLPMLVDALFGMTVWSLLSAGDTADPQAREELVDVISAVWLTSVWGVVPAGGDSSAQ